MSFWQGSISLFLTELKRSKWNFIVLVFLIFFAVTMTIELYAHILGFNENEAAASSFLGEYVFVLSFMGIGVMITFLYGAGFKMDLLAERLAYYRSLPIRTNQVVAARMIAIIATTLISMLAYYIVIATGIYVLYEQVLPLTTYASHGLLLFSLMIVGNYCLLYFDLCASSTLYTIFSFVISFGLLFLFILMSALTDNQFSLIRWSYTLSEGHPFLAIILAIVIFILSSGLALKLLGNSLKKRSFF